MDKKKTNKEAIGTSIILMIGISILLKTLLLILFAILASIAIFIFIKIWSM